MGMSADSVIWLGYTVVGATAAASEDAWSSRAHSGVGVADWANTHSKQLQQGYRRRDQQQSKYRDRVQGLGQDSNVQVDAPAATPAATPVGRYRRSDRAPVATPVVTPVGRYRRGDRSIHQQDKSQQTGPDIDRDHTHPPSLPLHPPAAATPSPMFTPLGLRGWGQQQQGGTTTIAANLLTQVSN